MSTAPAEIVRLVGQFDEHREAYRRGDYSETALRRDFVAPFFAALGWDVHNVRGYGEASGDVIHEDALRVARTNTAPDYGFAMGGVGKFFVEAKRPSVNIRRDAMAAFQLRRYAWTAKVPLSILTDFEELAVYDCRIKPDKNDEASTARILLFGYQEYVDRWEEIAGVFSREAVLNGAFDKYAESTRKKRGAAEKRAPWTASYRRTKHPSPTITYKVRTPRPVHSVKSRGGMHGRRVGGVGISRSCPTCRCRWYAPTGAAMSRHGNSTYWSTGT